MRMALNCQSEQLIFCQPSSTIQEKDKRAFQQSTVEDTELQAPQKLISKGGKVPRFKHWFKQELNYRDFKLLVCEMKNKEKFIAVKMVK